MRYSLRLLSFLLTCSLFVSAQQNTPARSKKEERKQQINQMIRQAEEGTLVYRHHSIMGLQIKNLGYGLFYEYGQMKSPRKTSIFRLDLTELKDRKEEKVQNAANGFIFFGNPYIYGKINNFYQANLSFGQQVILGQKGNKNGVSVTGIYSGGLAVGLLRPYYLQIFDETANEEKLVSYYSNDSLFLKGRPILGGGGLGTGWSELKFRPGFSARTALRFDYGRFNEAVSAIEIGLTGEYYAQKIPIMAGSNSRNFFFQGYIALLFGRRK